MDVDAGFDYKTAWQLMLYNHGNSMHCKMLTVANETSMLLRANCHYLMTPFCGTHLKCASVLGLIRAFRPQMDSGSFGRSYHERVKIVPQPIHLRNAVLLRNTSLKLITIMIIISIIHLFIWQPHRLKSTRKHYE